MHQPFGMRPCACANLVKQRDSSLLQQPCADAAEYVKLIGSNARRVMFDDTGHLSMVERPSAFKRVLTEFLAEERSPVAVSG